MKKYKRRFDEGIKIDNDKITFDYSDNEGVNISLIEGYAWLKTKHIPNSLP